MLAGTVECPIRPCVQERDVMIGYSWP